MTTDPTPSTHKAPSPARPPPTADSGERRACPADPVGGQLQTLRVGAQGCEVDRQAGRRGRLLLGEEEQPLVRRGRLVRGRAVQGPAGAARGTQPGGK
ncbi:hypothetical protein [Streptomyces afghaniensis]|uniref:hypothetical protein n=1 Tax=Streptomyces afghaniensis TaxID=66865 RepID=UPI002787D711|nr:hypothetical protein [Streptomyces afghaniensis]MDQ1022248.1 hypothetical protein [Streptomyces afghaniensis]